MPTPVLHLLAGPNGAGKSTLVARVLEPVTHLRFINADLIAADRWPDDPTGHAYDASQAAAAERTRLLEQHIAFITETVFSHPSKNALVIDAVRRGYLVHLHVILLPEETAVARVAHRVARGGHPVPEQKIRERYRRLWPLIVEARTVADQTTFYDNSLAKAPFRVVATYERGRLVGEADWPTWTPQPLTD